MNEQQRAAIMETLSLLAGLLLVASPSDRRLIQHNISSLKSAFPEIFMEEEKPNANN